MTRHKLLCAEFLEANYDKVFTHYQKLLNSENYVTRRQALKVRYSANGVSLKYTIVYLLLGQTRLYTKEVYIHQLYCILCTAAGRPAVG